MQLRCASRIFEHRTLTELTVELRIVVLVVIDAIVLGVIGANAGKPHFTINYPRWSASASRCRRKGFAAN